MPPRSRTAARRFLAVLATSVALAGCGGTDDESLAGSSPAPDVTAGAPHDAPDGGPTDDPRGAATDEPAGDGQLSAREIAESYLGLTEDEAELEASRQDRELRIGRRGDEHYLLTEDYRVGRITVELDRSGRDWVVVEVVLESDDGPVVASRSSAS